MYKSQVYAIVIPTVLGGYDVTAKRRLPCRERQKPLRIVAADEILRKKKFPPMKMAQRRTFYSPAPTAVQGPAVAQAAMSDMYQTNGKVHVMELHDSATGRQKVNSRTGKPEYVLLDPAPGPRQREYVVASGRRGARLRREYGQLYAAWADKLPPLNRPARGQGHARSTPTYNGQVLSILNPAKATLVGNQVNGTYRIAFGGSEYNKLLPLIAQASDPSNILLLELQRVAPEIAAIVRNDIVGRRINQYIMNPKPTGRTPRAIRVGAAKYNALLLDPSYRQAVGSAPPVPPPVRTPGGRARRSTRGPPRVGNLLFILNPDTGDRSRVEIIPGGAFTRALQGTHAQVAEQRALQAGATPAQIAEARAAVARTARRRGSRARTSPPAMAPIPIASPPRMVQSFAIPTALSPSQLVPQSAFVNLPPY